ncbi:hypothetical protein D3C72_1257850 [compost metagenome]
MICTALVKRPSPAPVRIRHNIRITERISTFNSPSAQISALEVMVCQTASRLCSLSGCCDTAACCRDISRSIFCFDSIGIGCTCCQTAICKGACCTRTYLDSIPVNHVAGYSHIIRRNRPTQGYGIRGCPGGCQILRSCRSFYVNSSALDWYDKIINIDMAPIIRSLINNFDIHGCAYILGSIPVSPRIPFGNSFGTRPIPITSRSA